MIEQKSLVINTTDRTHEIITINDPEIIGPIDYGLKEYEKGESFLLLGMGALSGSPIPGTHRLVATSYSQQWNYYYASSMGGAAYTMLRLGVQYIIIKGKATETNTLIINKKTGGEITVNFDPVNEDDVWKGYQDEQGFYAMQQYIHDQHKEEFKDCRVIATGPGAKYTRMGALGSAPITHGKITPVDSWCGRGGMGSQLFQQHGIAGIIYGGDEMIRREPITDRAKIDGMFEEDFGKKMMMEDLADTKKYRYDEKYKSGGTLGVNFTTLKGAMFSFNYRSVNWTEEERVALHQKLVVEHYLKQFNEETIETKQFMNCGEPCPVVCKKMRGKYKKDYEPYQALGPLSGIFDQRAAELANHYADTLGIDAINAGVTVAWIMDCLDEGILPQEALGLTKKPKFNLEGFDVVMDSMHNAELAVEILNKMMHDHHKLFKEGMRVAAKKLAEKYNEKILHKAAYNAQGTKGYMTPNQYWSPGMYSPMPLMGKYFTSYGGNYIEPREVGIKNVERMVYELYSENSGLCRFHRKWAEKILPKLVNNLYGENINYKAHHERLAKMIKQHDESVFWETEKIVDIIHGYVKRESSKDERAKTWNEKFDKDKWVAAKEYWEEIKAGQDEAFNKLGEQQ